MKTIVLLAITGLCFNILFAQVPQGISYQAVVRDAQGNIIVNQQVQFRFTILQDAHNGTVVYQETQNTTTNSLGLVNLIIGYGTPYVGSFSAIDWANHAHFLKVELDPQGGTNFVEMGVTQLLSVPYAMHAQTAANVQTYTAGNGISITGGVITNTAPDQPITLTGQGATTVSGTYPNFTISSTDSNTTYNAGTGLNLTGTTFEHAPHSGDVSGTTNLTVIGIQGKPVSNVQPTNEQVLQFNGTQWTPVQPSNLIQPGAGLNYTGNTLNTVWTQTGNNIYNNNPGRVGIGITAPTGKVTIQGDTSNVLFEVRDKDGNPVFVVYQDSVHVFVSNSNSKSNKGTFAVSSKAQTKAGGNTVFRVVPDSIVEIRDGQGLPVFQAFEDSVHVYVSNSPVKSNKGTFAVSSKAQTKSSTQYLRITPDSSRVYTEDPNAGFGVRDLSGGSATSYMQLTPENYFIGHQAGSQNDSGKFNIYLGYESGRQSVGSNFCTYLGYRTGVFNESSDNTFIGYTAGMFHRQGGGNVFIGSRAGQYDSLGSRNIFIGENSGHKNKYGINNVFIGVSTGYDNNNGSQNVFIGNSAGFKNNAGMANVFIGNLTGTQSKDGNSNIFIGDEAGYNNQNGHYNIFIGNNSGHENQDGICNVAIGYETGKNMKNCNYNTFMGMHAGRDVLSGLYNTMIGCNAGRFIKYSTSNSFYGTNAGLFFYSGDFNTFIGTDCGRGGNDTLNASLSSENTALGYAAGRNIKGANFNVYIGAYSGGYNSNGSNNVFLGYHSGMLNTGSGNIFIGYNSGAYDINSSNILIIENSSEQNKPLISGDFTNDRVGINRRATTYPFQVGTDANNGNAAYLTNGGTWTNASSKSYKDRFEDLNKNELLSKIEQLDIKAWYYKGTQERHIGPFAEDFYQAFGTGVLDEPTYLGKSLAAADVAGVSLAAVKELIKEINTLKKEVDELKRKNTELENKLYNHKTIEK